MIAVNDNDNSQERRTLWIVLLLNAAIAGGFFVTGAVADSSALIANGVDNLSDTAVYALSLVALTRGQTWKTRAAMASGVMLLLFAGGILLDVGRRFIQGSEPIGPTMMVMSAIAVKRSWRSSSCSWSVASFYETAAAAQSTAIR